MNLAAWERELADVMPRVIELRRNLHRHPEISGQETQTRDTLRTELEQLGIACVAFRDINGLMGVLRNGDGPCLAIRADMDALPIAEETGLTFASENPGVMHACGHDAHMALALGSARWLQTHRDRWRGTVKWLFEPEEETRGGGQWMVEQGCMENPRVDCVIGQHMNPHYDAGVFFAKPGPVSGASDEVRVTVRGRACHGAYPESGVDAIVIASQIVTALQTLVSRTLSPFDSAALTLGTIAGGTANNIVCGEVRMTGTLRTLTDETRVKMHREICDVCAGVARAMGGDAEVKLKAGYGAVCNDCAVYARAEKAAREILGPEKIVLRERPSLGVESFCYFVAGTPGTYYDLGCGKGTALHTATFRVDESCLLPGVALQCAIALSTLPV